MLLSLPHVAILRATKIISRPFPLFEKWRQKWASGQAIGGFENMYTAPVPITQMLEALMHLGTIKQKGIYHISGPEEISFHDLARLCADELKISQNLVSRCEATDHGIPANFIMRHPSLFPSGLEHMPIQDVRTVVMQYMKAVPYSSAGAR
jgi:dTDP-4-dehydrorhamnose reductase